MRKLVVVFVLREAIYSLAALVGMAVLVGLLAAETVIRVLGPATSPVTGKIIVIDPGHGGIDPGANDAQGVKEKDIVLAIASELRTLLGTVKAIPIQTRLGDWDLSDIYPDERTRHRQDLMARVHIAHKSQADALVSIHVNKSRSASASGAVTFYNPNQPESKRLAAALQRRLRELQPETAGWILPGDYYILRESKVPTVIVEVGFISNPEEKRLLLTGEYRQKLAQAIFEGLCDFFRGSPLSPSNQDPVPLTRSR
ncbi:MAG: hypothetical protein HPY71_08600 [Firmicutes bacterium]|nr:hypothetical protein [Bacillota bacterium]